jgi:hypothetical protein
MSTTTNLLFASGLLLALPGAVFATDPRDTSGTRAGSQTPGDTTGTTMTPGERSGGAMPGTSGTTGSEGRSPGTGSRTGSGQGGAGTGGN